LKAKLHRQKASAYFPPLPREKKLIKARRLKLLYHTRIAFCNQFYLCYNLKKQRILPHLRLSLHNGAAFLYARR
jgi:hypothetical protein